MTGAAGAAGSAGSVVSVGSADSAGSVRILSPVADLLGGVTPEGMVCGIDGVCAPIGSHGPVPSEQPGSSSTGEQS